MGVSSELAPGPVHLSSTVGSARIEQGPSQWEPRPVPAMKWFTDDQAGLPGKGGGFLTSHWDHMPPPLVTQWVWSCLGPSTGRGRRSSETWSLSPRPGPGEGGAGGPPGAWQHFWVRAGRGSTGRELLQAWPSGLKCWLLGWG